MSLVLLDEHARAAIATASAMKGRAALEGARWPNPRPIGCRLRRRWNGIRFYPQTLSIAKTATIVVDASKDGGRFG